MPYTLNGIGTWYYGRQNEHAAYGRCEHCGREGVLSSYDTMLWFVVVFIPLIPLGRKRVLNECSVCRRHRSLSLADWHRMKTEKLRAAGEAYAADTRSAAKARALLEAIVGFQDARALEQVAPVLEREFAGDAEVLALTGNAFAVLGRLPDTERLLRRALAVRDMESAREQLADCLVRQGKPDEALQQLAHIFTSRKEGAFDLLLFVMQGFQAVGRHEAALQLATRCEEFFPAACNTRAFRKAKRVSEKNRATGRPVNAKLLDAPQAGGPTVSPKVVLVGVCVALVAGAVVYLVSAVREGRNRVVYVVSGRDVAYTVDVNGQRVKLMPLRPKLLTVQEGVIRVTPVEAGGVMTQEQFEIRTPFLSRPLAKRTFVVNPDRVAVVYKETIPYGNFPAASVPPPKLYAGGVVYDVGKVDFPFETPPAQIRIEGSSATRTTVGVLTNLTSPSDVLRVVGESMDLDAAREYLRRALQFEPDDETLLTTCCALMKPEEAKAFLGTRLGDVPVRAGWHRLYQEVTERTNPEHDLRAEYRARLEKDPDNSDLIYLLGRVAPPAEARELFARAAGMTPPNGYAVGALAWDHLGAAEFERALELVRRAMRLQPDRESLKGIQAEALAGLRRYDEMLAMNAEARRKLPLEFGLASARVVILKLAGRSEEATKFIGDHCAGLKREGLPDSEINEVRLHLNASYFLAAGDAKRYADTVRVLPGYAFTRSLALDDVPAAAQALKEMAASEEGGKPGPYEYLVLYLAAAREGRHAAIAPDALRQAVEQLRKGSEDQRVAAKLLESAEVSAEDALAVSLQPSEKKLVLTALGVRSAAARKDAFALVRKLNYWPDNSKWVLDRVLAGQP